MKLQPGTEVTPNVRLESHLADGAMGAVWVAEHMTLNTKVAVKFISDRLDPDDHEVFERFVREASTAAQIKSSHVVQTFDQGVMRDGTPYIVMEFLEGEELGDKLQRQRTLPLPEVMRIITQTAKALGSAHKIGVIHRDIKPNNIFLSTRDDELHVKVFDFGIAKIRHPQLHTTPGEVDISAQLDDSAKMGLTNNGVMLGTPEYMSPEAVLDASNVDHHADLWALAVVAYICLCGELPFKGADVGELCVKLLEGKFTPPSQVGPDVPPEIDLFFKKAFAKNIDDRFQDARDLAQAFVSALPGLSMPAGDPMLASGGWEPRASLRSQPPPDPAGLKADSFSGAAADADLLMGRRKISSSTIGAFVAVGLVVVVGIVIASSSPEPAPSPASPAASSPPSMPELEPPKPEPATSASTEAETDEGEGGAKGKPAPTSVQTSRPNTGYAKPVPRPKAAPKNPGF